MKKRVDALMQRIDRRTLVLGGGVLAVGGLVGLNRSPPELWRPMLRAGEELSRTVQRSVIPDRPLVREYSLDQLTRNYPQNGGFGGGSDDDPNFESMLKDKFSSYKLTVDGLVERPASYSLAQLTSMPRRTQVTLHRCDEGWSAIAQWTGVPLAFILEQVGVRERARYVVFRCLDHYQGMQLYSSIDMFDALHPQTILAWGMNDRMLPKEYGAPLRLRAELQVGYKNSKHISRISVVDSLEGIGGGKGGLWEDMGYQWYAGL